MKIISWHNTLTVHQSHTFRALQQLVSEPIEFVLGKQDQGVRAKQGWVAPNTSDFNLHYLPSSGWWRRGKEIIDSNLGAIHVFNGLWVDKRLFPLLLYAQYKSTKTVLITEPYSNSDTGCFSDEPKFVSEIKRFMRPTLYKIAGILTAKKIGLVLAISHKAANQFDDAGFNRNLIFPFGYFVPKLDCPKSDIDEKGKLSAIFVGSLIKTKGFDIAIDAIKECISNGMDVKLDLYGPIVDDKIIKGICHRINYKGAIPFGETQCIIANYDFLILPSRYDGWGVVVNEAILQGVPALVSDQVGAKHLVESSGAGMVFKAGTSESLIICLEEILNNACVFSELKKHAIEYRALISPELAAKYMYDCFDFIFYGKATRPTCHFEAESLGV